MTANIRSAKGSYKALSGTAAPRTRTTATIATVCAASPDELVPSQRKYLLCRLMLLLTYVSAASEAKRGNALRSLVGEEEGARS